ncbi:uncharacterized protein LOC125648687 isoform X2 [Ostrea edulis]|uniref:uncharacterized protein LOC125648687 isoform X2 n=1 Tax=Ostrea edulis TaxID=37623 RepID=UPI0024AE9BCA|nr:uncharacterized protein LOC125648687 isoform X2 [Ostrea edulis]
MDEKWKSGRTTTGNTGPLRSSEGKYYIYIEADSRRNMTARVVSKFDLQDTNVTFSMQYHMYGSNIGTLTVFLRNRTRGELIIFRISGNQRTRQWISFEETFIVEGTWQLCIEAITKNENENKGDIAIDDVRIRINENDFKKTWMNLNERCIRNLGSYPLTKDQVPNTPCLSIDQERWTGIVRPQRNGPTDRVLERSPSAGKVFRFSGDMSIYTWETFDRDTLRPFVCEKLTGNFSDGNYSCSMYSKAKDAHSSQNAEVSGINSKEMDSKETCTVYEEESFFSASASEESNEIPLILLPVAAAFATLLVIIIVVMHLYYSRKEMRCIKHDNIPGTEVSYVNVTQKNTAKTPSTQIVSTEKQPQNVSTPQNTTADRMTGPSSGEEHVNKEVDSIEVRTRSFENDGRMEYENPEHYEHLIKENREPACYEDLKTEKREPACYEDLKTEKRESACYEDLKTEKRESACYEDLKTKKTEPACYEDLKTEKTEPPCYDRLKTEK